ncbi:MAG: adenine phosphoribosyltransferase [Bacteroidales bacterium]|nr:adenine phosphoribosyltransferase [Bacteroidales bacterium]
MTLEELTKTIRTVPDYPVPGILFYDVTTLFKNAEALQTVVDMTYELYKDKGITKVVGIESRGFVVGAALACRLGAGFVMARKPGKLPSTVASESYTKEYGRDTVEIHLDSIVEGDVVLIHDDLFATGGTVSAVNRLVRKFNPATVYDNFIIELPDLKGRERIPEGTPVTTLLSFAGD